jgi:signal transduction histidine kinase
MAAMTDELAGSHDLLEERVREATQELAGQKNAAERANTAKSRFLAAASHDLRQPLHALSLFATDLQRQLRSGTAKELPRLAEQIAASTTILGELLDSLLDISRLDVAGIKPDSRPAPVQPIFERLANSFRRAATDRNITLRFRPSRLWVESDPIMLERMIANLVSNALRYTQPGGCVLVAARSRGNRVSIEVRDNGIGIAAEHQAAIFAEFYQVGNVAREQNKGLGLGLSAGHRGDASFAPGRRHEILARRGTQPSGDRHTGGRHNRVTHRQGPLHRQLGRNAGLHRVDGTLGLCRQC